MLRDIVANGNLAYSTHVLVLGLLHLNKSPSVEVRRPDGVELASLGGTSPRLLQLGVFSLLPVPGRPGRCAGETELHQQAPCRCQAAMLRKDGEGATLRQDLDRLVTQSAHGAGGRVRTEGADLEPVV